MGRPRTWRGIIRKRKRFDSERKLQDRITQLETENSELKKKIAKMENVILTALDLLTRKY